MVELLFILTLLSGFEPPVTFAGLQCLQQNVYYEAGNQSFDGKLAVASVTLNRKQATGFPDRVCDVVGQKWRGICQFSWVCSKPKRRSNKAEDRAKLLSWLAAVHVVLNGPTIDALYFHTTEISPDWSERVPKLAQIDDHIFYGG